MTAQSANLQSSGRPPDDGGFSERAAVEKPAIDLFRSLGWRHSGLYYETFGPSGTEGRVSMREAVLPNRLGAALQKFNPHLSPDALRDVAAEIVRDRSAMLPADANAEIYRLLKDGVPVQVRGPDGERKSEIARVINWRDPRANDLVLAQQVWFQGELYKRRADLVGFVNGLPLLLIELKGPGENVKDAFDNNIRSYRSDIPGVSSGIRKAPARAFRCCTSLKKSCARSLAIGPLSSSPIGRSSMTKLPAPLRRAVR
jgi:type I restriction enzyme R subunit